MTAFKPVFILNVLWFGGSFAAWILPPGPTCEACGDCDTFQPGKPRNARFESLNLNSTLYWNPPDSDIFPFKKILYTVEYCWDDKGHEHTHPWVLHPQCENITETSCNFLPRHFNNYDSIYKVTHFWKKVSYDRTWKARIFVAALVREYPGLSFQPEFDYYYENCTNSTLANCTQDLPLTEKPLSPVMVWKQSGYSCAKVNPSSDSLLGPPEVEQFSRTTTSIYLQWSIPLTPYSGLHVNEVKSTCYNYTLWETINDTRKFKKEGEIDEIQIPTGHEYKIGANFTNLSPGRFYYFAIQGYFENTWSVRRTYGKKSKTYKIKTDYIAPVRGVSEVALDYLRLNCSKPLQRQVTITWEPPPSDQEQTGNLNYLVEMTQADISVSNYSTQLTHITLDIDWEEYQVVVIVFNSVGRLKGRNFTRIKKLLLDPPTIVKANATSPGSVVITWEPPHFNQCLSNYRIQRSSNFSVEDRVLAADKRHYKFDGLQTGQNYTFSVMASIWGMPGPSTSTTVNIKNFDVKTDGAGYKNKKSPNLSSLGYIPLAVIGISVVVFLLLSKMAGKFDSEEEKQMPTIVRKMLEADGDIYIDILPPVETFDNLVEANEETESEGDHLTHTPKQGSGNLVAKEINANLERPLVFAEQANDDGDIEMSYCTVQSAKRQQYTSLAQKIRNSTSSDTDKSSISSYSKLGQNALESAALTKGEAESLINSKETTI